MVSAEAKRAAARERARKYRARKREAEAAGRPLPRDVAAGTVMRDAVASALGAMKWLATSDDASVVQARMLAQQVDELTAAGATTKLLAAHAALQRTLGALAGTPTVRLQHELRALRVAGRTEDDDADEQQHDEQQPSGNVTPIARPVPRRPA